MLTVYSDGQQFKMHFLILDRTNPSKAERAAGAKEQRFEVLNETFFISLEDQIIPASYPLPELVQKFIDFLKEGKSA